MSSRRRGLIGTAADGWVDTGFDLSGFVPNGDTVLSYNAESRELLFYTTKNNTYRNVYKVFNWETGYEYMVEYDVSVFSGLHLSGFRAGTTMHARTSGQITVSQHVRFIYDTQTYNIDYFAFYCTWNTSQYGACAISNFKIYKKPLEV